jgi:peptidoglycan/xylan/chitin deacetylase (PgdA/CDA1 family)
MELIDKDIPGPRRNYPGYGRRPPKVVWPDGANLVINLVVNNEEGSEYSWAAGDARNEGLAEIPYVMGPEARDLSAESVYEYGSRAGIWRLLRLFDEYNVKTTFFTAAVALTRNPEVGQWVREAGHEPCAHGWRWIEQWTLSRDVERQHIAAAIEDIRAATGERPLGWYCRYGPSVNTRELLVEEGGFVYDADAYNDDLPYFVEVKGKQHLVVPYTLTYNDGRFVLPQGYAGPADFFDSLKRAMDELLREGRSGYPRMMSVGLHPRWTGQAGRTSGLREFIEYVQATPDVKFMRRIDIARWWLDHHEEFGY